MIAKKSYLVAAAGLVAAALGVGAWQMMKPAGGVFAECGGGLATGAASLGGPFTLVDHTGATVTEADVITGPTLIYFGYTFCPDVCPTDVAVMAQAVDLLAESGRKATPVFITIDPARDTETALAEFVGVMHPKMRGLTGTDAQIATAAKAYRVYYQKAPGDDPDYYLMDHSAFTYLVAPGVGFLDVFRHGASAEDIAAKTACYIDALPQA